MLKIAKGARGIEVADNGLLRRRARQTISEWVARYREQGVEGLEIRTGQGRKPVEKLNCYIIFRRPLNSPVPRIPFIPLRWCPRWQSETIENSADCLGRVNGLNNAHSMDIGTIGRARAGGEHCARLNVLSCPAAETEVERSVPGKVAVQIQSSNRPLKWWHGRIGERRKQKQQRERITTS
jgi:hypothetical protein